MGTMLPFGRGSWDIAQESLQVSAHASEGVGHNGVTPVVVEGVRPFGATNP
ncbi:hypothetical protein SUDANB66_06623 (plasmid) [Streptomyces sp. SudanB66_2053]